MHLCVSKKCKPANPPNSFAVEVVSKLPSSRCTHSARQHTQCPTGCSPKTPSFLSHTRAHTSRLAVDIKQQLRCTTHNHNDAQKMQNAQKTHQKRLNGLEFAFAVVRFYFAFTVVSTVRPPSYFFTLLSTAVHISKGSAYTNFVDWLTDQTLLAVPFKCKTHSALSPFYQLHWTDVFAYETNWTSTQNFRLQSKQ